MATSNPRRTNPRNGTSSDRPTGSPGKPKKRRAVWLCLGILLTTLTAASLIAYQTGKRDWAASSEHEVTGPWGNLTYTDIRLEPAANRIREAYPDLLHTVQTNYIADDSRIWFFDTTNSNEIKDILAKAQLPAHLLQQTLDSYAPTNCGNLTKGCLKPSKETILAIPSQTRLAFYNELAKVNENVSFQDPYRFNGTVEEWFNDNNIPAPTLEIIRRLVVPIGTCMALYDIETVLSGSTNETVTLNILKNVAAMKTYLLKLRIDKDSDIQAIDTYWSGFNRRKDIYPILESLRNKGDTVRLDVAHLLPYLPRGRLYTYPTKPRNCHWASLNFFRDEPTPEIPTNAEIESDVTQKYQQVFDPPRFGDLLLLLAKNRSSNNLLHSAIYLADNFVYTKNGLGPNLPFVYMTIDEMKGIYDVSEPVIITRFRLKPNVQP